jgi:hypothetical protein
VATAPDRQPVRVLLVPSERISVSNGYQATIGVR